MRGSLVRIQLCPPVLPPRVARDGKNRRGTYDRKVRKGLLPPGRRADHQSFERRKAHDRDIRPIAALSGRGLTWLWRSLRTREIAGSNPAAQTIFRAGLAYWQGNSPPNCGTEFDSQVPLQLFFEKK